MLPTGERAFRTGALIVGTAILLLILLLVAGVLLW